jgi:hypothetical protein
VVEQMKVWMAQQGVADGDCVPEDCVTIWGVFSVKAVKWLCMKVEVGFEMLGDKAMWLCEVVKEGFETVKEDVLWLCARRRRRLSDEHDV